MDKLCYTQYKDKVRAGWLGKCIAGNMGAPLECCKMQMNFSSASEYAPTELFANDDLDLQIIWLQVLLEKGKDFTSDDLMDAFIRCYESSPNEYGYAKRNYMRGIHPPYSGTYANDFFMYSMGCPIRSEIWAMIHPGDPAQAAACAARDGCIDHGGESIAAEQYLAALEAMAFYHDQPEWLIEESIRYIQEESMIARIVQEVLAGYRKRKPWKLMAGELERRYGNQDCSSVFYNFSVILLALLYGKGDFEQTITLAVNGGYDTDCTAATAGAVLGIMYGSQVIDEKWRKIADGPIVTGCSNLAVSVETLEELTELTCQVRMHSPVGPGSYLAERHGQAGAEGFTWEMSYLDGIEIYPGEQRQVSIQVRNRYQRTVSCELHLQCPEGLEGLCDITALTLVPDQAVNIRCTIRMHREIGRISDTNICRLVLQEDSGTINYYEFGFAGGQPWKILGPYYNLYNFHQVPESVRREEKAYYQIPSREIYRYYNLAEAHNNFVFADEAYIREEFGEQSFEGYWQSGHIYLGKEDQLTIDEMFGFKGCCCIYALQRIYMERQENLQLHIGSTTPFKIWLNGEQIYEQHESNGYCPYTDLVMAKFREGENQLVIKLLRYGEKQKFSFVMRQAPYGHSGLIRTGMSYLL